MYVVEVIYEKKYPRIDLKEEMEKIRQEALNEPIPTTDEILKNMEKSTSYIFLPERDKASKEFIQEAIAVSELYELDTTIKRFESHISVSYSFNCCGPLRYINRIFGMADQVSFFKGVHGWDITVSLDCYTHAVLRNNRIVSP